VIIEAIHRHALQARDAQLELLRATRRAPGLAGAAHVVRVAAVSHGFVTSVDVGAIRSAVDRAGAAAEVVLLVSVGSYVVFGQALAEVRSPLRAAAVAVAGMLEQAIERGTKRDLANDPLDAIEELETIAWTSISTAQSDPDAGVLAIYGLRDMLARWHDLPEAGSADSPVVYADDVLPRLLSAFESLAVVASESMQHQSYAEILRTFDIVFERLLPAQRERVEDILKRTLSAMGEHVLTAELEGAITSLVATLERSGCARTAAALAAAMHKLAGSIGKLGSRATRPV
jgi:hypothetical protein